MIFFARKAFVHIFIRQKTTHMHAPQLANRFGLSDCLVKTKWDFAGYARGFQCNWGGKLRWVFFIAKKFVSALFIIILAFYISSRRD